jgi:hypothetical protein
VSQADLSLFFKLSIFSSLFKRCVTNCVPIFEGLQPYKTPS